MGTELQQELKSVKSSTKPKRKVIPFTDHSIEANLMLGLRKGYLYRACLFNLGMSYEQMIITITDTGLSS